MTQSIRLPSRTPEDGGSELKWQVSFHKGRWGRRVKEEKGILREDARPPAELKGGGGGGGGDGVAGL